MEKANYMVFIESGQKLNKLPSDFSSMHFKAHPFMVRAAALEPWAVGRTEIGWYSAR